MLLQGLCRTEQRDTRWSFSGYATATANENTVRPRGYYRSCTSCRNVVLTLADVDDGLSLCKAVMSEWLRKAGGASDKVDVENVIGDLFESLWKLYNRWVPGGLTFTSYSTGILRKKIHTFVALDVGDPRAGRNVTKAHSRSHTQSYEGLVENVADGNGNERGRAASSGLDFALGRGSLDPTGDHVQGRSWLHEGRDRDGTWSDDGGGSSSLGRVEGRAGSAA